MDAEVERRLWWRAVYALREAETLAQLGNVSGPADAPPESEEKKPGWVKDWAARGKQALKDAYEKAASGNAKLRDRAKRIAGHVRDGINAIKQSAPVLAAKEKLDAMVSATQWLQGGMFGLGIVGTGLLLWVAWEVFLKGK